jgi:putative hydrolase of HD superfamily
MPNIIRKSLLQRIFSGAYMKRWNDKLRPMEFMEADKQAHKMIAAWILSLLNSEKLGLKERLDLQQEVIERALFDYFFRLVITDIKPPVYYRIKKNPAHYRDLAEWVIEEMAPVLSGADSGFWERFKAHSMAPDKDDLAARILDAAHHYASNWELSIIKDMNSFDPELPFIIEDFKNRLAHYEGLEGMRQLNSFAPTALGSFARLCGQLRFQKRWSQTPRIPETSVMGHMFFVACYAYFFSLAVGAGQARRVNNFFCALFHDLPELLTRDIISPVKKSVHKLDLLIRNYEEEELHRRVFSPLREEGWELLVARLSYYLGLEIGSEFYECACVDGKARRVSFEDLQTLFNADEFDSKDGDLLKICDSLAAFIEAYTAQRNGISSDELNQAVWRIRTGLSKKEIGGLHIGVLLADFD